MADATERIAELEAELGRLAAEMVEERRSHARALSELRLSEEKFAQAFQATPDAININRARDGLYVAVNPGFLALTGYAEAEVVGRTSTELDVWAHPEDRNSFVRLLTEKGSAELETQFRVKDGSLRVGLISGRLVEVDGEPCILSITRDLSARLNAEEKLRQLVDLAADAIISVDPRWLIVSVNRQGCELVGRSPTDLQGRHLHTLFTRESLAKRPLRFEELAGELGRTVEREILRPDGRCVPVEMKSRRVPDGTYHIFIRDLSERRRVEEERRALSERLRLAEKNEALGRLASGVAHDFNNLLTPILTLVSLRLREVNLAPDLRSDLQEILDAAERAAALVRQILAFSRKQVLRLVELDVNAELRAMTRMLCRVIGEDVRVDITCGDEVPPVFADAAQLGQVIVNLVVNARDALPGGGRIQLTTSRFVVGPQGEPDHPELAPGVYARLEVSDDGVGMDEATLRRAFDPFFTTKEPGRGTGLGLATVRGIVEQHGGTLWATSEKGAGSTFYICLPAATGGGGVAPPGAVAATPALPPRLVALVVEDEAVVRSVMVRILQRQGLEILSAGSADEALVRARARGHVDVLLTDLVLPGVGGERLAAQLRDLYPGLRIVFVSGYGGEVEGRPVLAKPFTADALTAAVRRALGDE